VRSVIAPLQVAHTAKPVSRIGPVVSLKRGGAGAHMKPVNLRDLSGKTRSGLNIRCGQSGIALENARHRNIKIIFLSNIDFAIAARACKHHRLVACRKPAGKEQPCVKEQYAMLEFLIFTVENAKLLGFDLAE
jgi:hypothetical protein